MSVPSQHATNGFKTLVLGLDGGCFRVLRPLMNRGLMPNLSSLVGKGVWRVLQSTVPPVTGPAWTTFMTGVNPAQHGIFDFVRRVPGKMERQVVAHNQIAANTLFQIVGHAGLKVGSINLPLTYPPPHVNGFVVSGMLTPGPESEFTYPPELKEQLNRVANPYILDVWWKRYSEHNAADFVARLAECLRHRTTAIRHLMKHHQWNLLVAVLTEVDRIQHSLWNYLNPDEGPEPGDLPRYRQVHKAVLEFYATLDSAIGDITGELPQDANLVIVSDHGFGPMRKKFYVNTWLRNEGFLSVNERLWNSRKRRKTARRLSRKVIASLRLGGIASGARRLLWAQRSGRMMPFDVLQCFDWRNTTCYAASYSEQGLYVNLKGREPYGTVSPGGEYEATRERVIERLKALHDPSAEHPLRVEVLRKEEVYSGPYLDDAPDIIFAVEDGAYLADIGLEQNVFMNSTWETGTGTHRPDGIFIAAGPDIRPGGELSAANIIDVAPTVLHLLRLPTPKNMEGAAMTDILGGELARSPVTYCDPLARSEVERAAAYTDEEENLVRDKLSGLGYMD
ncbi:MAG: alkaline phosphatase family protein [Candidatus Abyssubacteria bacterium]